MPRKKEVAVGPVRKGQKGEFSWGRGVSFGW